MSTSNDYPIVGYRFMVVIFSAGVPNPIDIRFKEVSGLKMSRTISRQGQMTTLASELPQQTLTLKRGVMLNASPLVISQLVESAMWGTRILRKDLLVSVLDNEDTPINSWMINNAYLSSWSWDGVNGDSKDVLIETMEFSYSSLIYLPVEKPAFVDDLAAKASKAVNTAKETVVSKVKEGVEVIEDEVDEVIDEVSDVIEEEIEDAVEDASIPQ